MKLDILKLGFLYFMCVCIVPVCIYVCPVQACCLWRSEEAPDPPALELRTVMSCHVCVEN